MTTKYYAILTTTGAALLANATALGRQLSITQMALGDGGGTLPTPDPAQTKLVNECRRASLNSLSVDPANPSQIIAEQVIPEDEGGWWIREIGLYDAAGNLIAVANCPETYKPQLQEGSGRVQTVRMILIVSSTDAVTLKIDPSVVLATRAYTDTKAAEAKAYADGQASSAKGEAQVYTDNQISGVKTETKSYTDALINGAKGEARSYSDVQTSSAKIEVKAYADNLITAHLSAANPHPQYALSTDVTAANQLKLDIAEMVGIPLPWPQATAPTGWLKCNGQAFDKTLYHKLASVYPTGVLPDLRGEFIRGWDDGRGMDSGRTIISKQNATGLRTGALDYNGSDTDSIGVYIGIGYADADSSANTVNFTNQNYPNGVMMSGGAGKDNGVSGTASNTVFSSGVNWITVRPRNVAFNYIVRAA
ncbi:phage tail-collar fiber domain-containing protein [Dickeya undicola]|uniref:phage tail-collar fiber domain-containing protein n=1 Tax=Dickeya undicola TaxID=1577887 RepID=UPI003F2826A8